MTETKKKKIIYSELAYLLGNVLIAVGVAFMEKSNFGVSMVVAPAYLIYRWISPIWPVMTFGMAEYCLQGVLLLLMMLILRKFRLSWLFSFLTAVFYGFILDGVMLLVAFIPDPLWVRIVLYVLGMIICAAGVSFMFHTYISPEVYELFVKEVSAGFGKDIHRFKTCYDIASLIVGIIMSFLIFGLWKFEGVKWGTIVCALINGFIISLFSKFYEKNFEFVDRWKFRDFFEGKKQVTNENAEE